MKYYVSSGDLHVVIERESRLFAALDVLAVYADAERDMDVDGIVRVNETGFEPKDTDTIFETAELFIQISEESDG